MDRIGERLTFAVLGFLVGCLGWGAIYLIVQLIFKITGVDHVRFRLPIFVFFLPIVTAYLGFQIVGPSSKK